MEQEKVTKLYELIRNIPLTEENTEIIKEIKEDIENKVK